MIDQLNLYIANLLFYTLLFPIFGILLLLLIVDGWFLPKTEERLRKFVALSSSCLSFIGSLLLWDIFQVSFGFFKLNFKWFYLDFTLFADDTSVYFLMLTTFMIPTGLLVYWNNLKNLKLREFLIAFLFLEFFLVAAICIKELFYFYIFFQIVLIPIVLWISIWGSTRRKLLVIYWFFLHTLLATVFMLLSILYIYYQVGTVDYKILLTFSFSPIEQNLLCFIFFFYFASKGPMIIFLLITCLRLIVWQTLLF